MSPPDTIRVVNGLQKDAYTYYPILIVGAGESGIALGARLKEEGFDQYRIFERQAGIGGTWWINRYPGVACDVYALILLFEKDRADRVQSDQLHFTPFHSLPITDGPASILAAPKYTSTFAKSRRSTSSLIRFKSTPMSPSSAGSKMSSFGKLRSLTWYPERAI